ncbi:MAG: nucleotidyltransferase domain-containing protein [Bacteroidetes bacterium]|nr:hypothetical protein AWN76_018185 [Rhodothermaceae bacterium RA]RMH70429.1 MAG: nucleotidyltransferase domain-containing protein [Bacteroidota bacterium]
MVQATVERLVKALAPEQIWLFGSQVWGVPGAASDLDVLVIVPESNDSPAQRARQAHRALRGIALPMDILVKTRAEIEHTGTVPSSLVYKILREGRCVYG